MRLRIRVNYKVATVFLMMTFSWYCIHCSRQNQQQQELQQLYEHYIYRDIKLQEAVSPRYPLSNTYYHRLKFEISLLDLLQKADIHKDIVYSPHGLYQAILLTYFGSAGETKHEIDKMSGLD